MDQLVLNKKEKNLKNERNKKHWSLVICAILLLLIGISIGYAALSTTLSIKGTSTIGKATWDIHFENVNTTSGSVAATTAPTAPATGTAAITYSVYLTEPGDYYEFTVDVKSSGTIDAKLGSDPIIAGVSTAQDVYTNYSVTYEDGSSINAEDTLNTGETKTIKVRVEYDFDIASSDLPTEEQTMNLTFDMNYVQA